METLSLTYKPLDLIPTASCLSAGSRSTAFGSSSIYSKPIFIPQISPPLQERSDPTAALPADSQAFFKMASEALNADSNCQEDTEVQKFLTESSELSLIIEFPYFKTHEQIRTDYIEKLRYLKIMKENHIKPHQTVSIFDWDDTILPTSYLCHVGLDKISPELESKLQVLDRKTAKLLLKAAQVGKVYIVTNSAESWVQTSGKKYLPLTEKVIEDERITVISARAQYAETCPRDPKKWKADTFASIGESFDLRVPTNILSLGDGEFEIEAAGLLGKMFQQSLVKTVKYKEYPSADELIRQTSLVLEKFEQIYTTLKTLSIRLAKKN